MARLSLSKSSLSAQSRQLKSFQRFLPSLDMKRKQLLAERARALGAKSEATTRLEALRRQVAETLPMLSNREIDLSELARVERVDMDRENVMGVWLPRLSQVHFEIRPYGYLTKPHWVDRFVEALTRMLELRVNLIVAERRVALLDAAVRKVTQRVNLFDKVLIPQTQASIKRIRIALSDAERAAVVRSKIAKKKRAAEGLA